MRAIYFHDPDDGSDRDLEIIKASLQKHGIKRLKIESTDVPPWHENYDILFFDWGGMSLGNSMLEHFCRYFLNEAREKPGRAFVMTSEFTKYAMEDACLVMGREVEGKPSNVFLTIESAVPWIKILLSSSNKMSKL